MPRVTLTVVLLAPLVLTACSGDGDGNGASGGAGRGESVAGTGIAETEAQAIKTFEGDGYSFSYPEAWQERHPDVGFVVGTPLSETYVGLDDTNILSVVVANGPVSITETNIDDYEPEFLALVSETFAQQGGEVTGGPRQVSVDGLPGVEFEGWVLNVEGIRVDSRLTVAFDGTKQYSMNCQFRPAREDDMMRGCDQVKESFQAG